MLGHGWGDNQARVRYKGIDRSRSSPSLTSGRVKITPDYEAEVLVIPMASVIRVPPTVPCVIAPVGLHCFARHLLWECVRSQLPCARAGLKGYLDSKGCSIIVPATARDLPRLIIPNRELSRCVHSDSPFPWSAQTSNIC